MPTRLLLEGRDLEALLAQVQEEHGPAAKIVSAERVRTGGIAGLFSQQKFELTVEIPDDATPTSAAPRDAAAATPAAPTAAPAKSVSAALAKKSAPSGAAGKPATPAKPAQGTPPAQPAQSAPVTVEQLAALADAADDLTPGSSVAAAPASPQAPPGAAGTAFADVLAGVRTTPGATRPPTAADALAALFGDDSPMARENPSAPTNPNGASSAAPSNGGESEEPDEAVPSVRPFRPEAGQNVPKLGLRPLPLPPLATDDDASTVEPVIAPPISQPPPPPTESTERQETQVTVDAPAAVAGPAVGLYTANAGSAGTPSTPTQSTAPPATERPGALPRRLQALGVPPDLARQATGPDSYTAIVAALEGLPSAAPAPDGPGETLVVIGDPIHAVAAARVVVDSLRLEQSDLLFAGRTVAGTGVDKGRRIAGPHDARHWAKRLRKADVPSVVALEAAPDEADWAVSIVDAIRPAAVWVVIDASRKTADISRQLRSLRRVDALAVRGTAASGDPASMLALGVPVAQLDGRAPTPHAWAALLCERLTKTGG